MNRDILQVSDWLPWPGRSPRSIRTWRRFRRDIRNRGWPLLGRLGEFDDPILVAGCQRSGTTALARAITQSPGMTNYWFGRDDELDAAMILAGCLPHEPRGRYCFQTTYVNECYQEYSDHAGQFRMVWVLRNPVSVVYSMLHNWGRFAFDELFRYCGADALDAEERQRFDRLGPRAVPRLHQGCFSYTAKVSQILSLHETLGYGDLLVLDYDALVLNPTQVLPVVYQFLQLEYQANYVDWFSARSVAKADGFSAHERGTVNSLCEPVYERALTLFAQDQRFATVSQEVAEMTRGCARRQA